MAPRRGGDHRHDARRGAPALHDAPLQGSGRLAEQQGRRLQRLRRHRGPVMTGNKTQRGSPPQKQQICALVTTVLKLEEEATTMKQLLIQLSARLLRLELALSVLDTDGSLTAILRPEQFQSEQF